MANVDTVPNPAPLTVPVSAPGTVDLVLEGGGVKGIALVGAICELADAGFTVGRIAGTSAGALVGAVAAAMTTYGESLTRLDDVAREIDFASFADRGAPARFAGPLLGIRPLGLVANSVNVLLDDGAFVGARMRNWLAGTLKQYGVRTFADLRRHDVGDDHSINSRYGLVAMATDVSRKRLVRLPWDYPVYGLDPDHQQVADAVRASASLPFVFRPVQLRGPLGTATLVDGGILSNYPISVFDRTDGQPSRWPTIGIRLDAMNLDRPIGRLRKVDGPAALGVAVIETAIEGNQAEHITDPVNIARSILVPTNNVGVLDFSISRGQMDDLINLGREATRAFIAEREIA